MNYQRLEHGKKSYEDYFVVNWCFFTICNFACSYCPTSLHDGKQRGLPIDTVKTFCRNVIEQKAGKKVFFEFTGGEVTFYKSFPELFTYLKDLGADTGLISNGSRDLEFWKKHKHLIDHICLSFHPEQGDPDHFFEVVKLLNDTVTVHVNIMMLPAKFDMLHDLAKRIASEIEGISVSMQALFEQMSGAIFTYTPDQKAVLDAQTLPWGQSLKYFQHPDKVRKVYRGEMKTVNAAGEATVVVPPELIARGENNWMGWDCHIGLENIVINPNGDVMRGWCGVGGVFGNVQQSDFKLPTKPIRCSSSTCHCGLDIMATKEMVK
jgi:MoaA/NifB/PqqE/SkfB family radical SAM enzyme